MIQTMIAMNRKSWQYPQMLLRAFGICEMGCIIRRPCLFVETLLMVGFVLGGSAQQMSGDAKSCRLVVTFLTVKDNVNASELDLGGAKVVKQYGRRLVLDLGSPFDLNAEHTRLEAVFIAVQTVERDYLVGLQDVDPPPLTVHDLGSNTNQSSTVYSTYSIEPVTQTPLWNLMDSEPYSIHAEGVWSVTNSTPNVVVAIIDTGMAELAKPMFINLLDGYDFISDDGISIDWDGRDPDATDPGDWGDNCPAPSWHGTKVASILAARHDNEFGMKGVAQNCSVLPVRVLGLCRMGYATDVTDAIVWSAGGTINGVPDNANPAKIISLSIAGQGACPGYLQSAVSQAITLGSIIIAAAGNNNQDVAGYFPANCEGVIAVAASTRDGTLAPYSDWGSMIAVSAPGGDSIDAIMTLSVDSLQDGLQIAYGIGTSFAVPHVTGVAAVYVSIDNNCSHLFSNFNFSADSQMHGVTFYFSPIVKSMGDSKCFIKQEECSGHGIISMGKTNYVNISYYSPSLPLSPSYNYSSPVLYHDSNTTSNSSFKETFSSWDLNQSVYAAAQYCQEGYYCIDLKAPYCTACGRGTFRSIPYTRPWAPMGWSSSTMMDGHATGCVYWMMAMDQPVYTCTSGLYVWWWYFGWFGSWTFESDTYTSNFNGPETWVSGGYAPLSSLVPLLSGIQYCSACPAGKYIHFSGSTYCLPCPSGSYSGGGATICTICPAGTYSGLEASSNCAQCSAGQYSTALGAVLSSNCQLCTAGTYSTANGLQTSANCAKCSTGQYSTTLGASMCQLCPAGTYFTGTGIQTSASCTQCSAGHYSSVLGATIASTCQLCNAGTYGLISASMACIGCSPGTFSIATGAVSGATCLNCEKGYYFSSEAGTVCSICMAGSYSSFSGASKCTSFDCLAGMYTSSAGLISSSMACIGCTPGTFSIVVRAISSAVCTKCEKGSYYTGISSSKCTSCAPGGYSDTTGSVACTLCRTGTYGLISGLISASMACTLCPPGTFNNISGANSSSACIKCEKGAYSAISYSSSCVLCPPGGYSDIVGVASCTPCTAGTYVSEQGKSSCISCSSGAYSTALAWCPSNTFAPSVISTIFQCTAMAGYYGNPGSPAVECPYDHYCTAKSVVPIPCPPNHTTSGTRSTSLNNCTSWMAVPCRPGFYMDFSFYHNQSSTPFCSPCASGCYCPGDSDMMVCGDIYNLDSKNCFSPPKSTSYTQCTQPGSFSSSYSVQCPQNTKGPSVGNTAKSLFQCRADVGFYYIPGSSLSAVPCSPGTFCPQRVIVAPILCPPFNASYSECLVGQYPLSSSLCPLSQMTMYLDICQSCSGLPSNAAWTSNMDSSCPYCCNDPSYYRTGNVCGLHPTTASCPEKKVIPSPPRCLNGILECRDCALSPSTPELSALNVTYRNSLISLDSLSLSFDTCFWGCSPGYCGDYQVTNNKASCTACSAGFFKSFSGDAVGCSFCPEGKYSAAPAASACVQCPLYSRSNAVRTSCICMAGTYTSMSATDNTMTCPVCNTGSISVEGASLCNSCNAGSYWVPGRQVV